MTLTPGTQLGSCEIVSLLGTGGMGEVYRARDTRLKRDVALKILPPVFSADEDRAARFEREAEVLATLNHPHVAQIYGFIDTATETGTRVRALVLELVDGATLADRIAQGAVSIEEALAIARQIAEALEAAHDQGIVHRDLKPANIKLRPDGTVKVLDFGLAKLGPTGASSVTSAAGATRPHRASEAVTSPAHTEVGMILGTAAYMAPEQAKGKPADKRADIWAFGVVLYEMLTGRALFASDSVAETLVALMTRDLDWRALPADLPRSVRHLLHRCLDRDPRTRLRDIGEARIALSAGREPNDSIDDARARPRRRHAIVAIAAGLGMVAGVGATMLWRGATPAATVRPRALQIAFGDTVYTPAISPDGSAVVFVRNEKLVVRRLESLEERELEGTEGASVPFWAPDSRSIGYFAEGELRAVASTGGGSRLLVNSAFAPFGGAWCGERVLFTRWANGLFEMRGVGQPSNVPFVGPKYSRVIHPSCVGDGRVLLAARGSDQSVSAAVVLLDGDRLVTLFEQPTGGIEQPVFVSPDRIVFYRSDPDAGLWSLPVAKDLSTSTGPPVLLQKGAENPSTSRDGLLVYLSGRERVGQQLVTVERTGRRVRTLGRSLPALLTVAAAPDGSSVATMANAGEKRSGIWLHYENSARPWQDGADHPVWSPTSDRLAYDTNEGIFVRAVSGNVAPQLVLRGDRLRTLAWSPDGDQILYADRDLLFTVGLRMGARPQRLVEGRDGALSPDGRWLAFADDATVYVTSFPAVGKVWPVSAGAGERHPRWNPRGGELFFAGGARVGEDPNSRREIWAVSIDTAGDGRPGTPQRLFDALALNLALTFTGSRSFDIAPDGQHIVLKSTGLEGVAVINAIQNAHVWMTQR